MRALCMSGLVAALCAAAAQCGFVLVLTVAVAVAVALAAAVAVAAWIPAQKPVISVQKYKRTFLK